MPVNEILPNGVCYETWGFPVVRLGSTKLPLMVYKCKGVRLHIPNPKQVDRLATSLHKADLQISNASCTQI